MTTFLVATALVSALVVWWVDLEEEMYEIAVDGLTPAASFREGMVVSLDSSTRSRRYVVVAVKVTWEYVMYGYDAVKDANRQMTLLVYPVRGPGSVAHVPDVSLGVGHGGAFDRLFWAVLRAVGSFKGFQQACHSLRHSVVHLARPHDRPDDRTS